MNSLAEALDFDGIRNNLIIVKVGVGVIVE
jgi:hypothetical protein